MLNRRFFHRVDVRANGELVWATKSRLGRVSTNRQFITTENISIDGAKVLLEGKHHFPTEARARLKLGLEFCDVEVLQSFDKNGDTVLRLRFISPSQRFIAIVERWMPIETSGRKHHQQAWT